MASVAPRTVQAVALHLACSVGMVEVGRTREDTGQAGSGQEKVSPRSTGNRDGDEQEAARAAVGCWQTGGATRRLLKSSHALLDRRACLHTVDRQAAVSAASLCVSNVRPGYYAHLRDAIKSDAVFTQTDNTLLDARSKRKTVTSAAAAAGTPRGATPRRPLARRVPSQSSLAGSPRPSSPRGSISGSWGPAAGTGRPALPHIRSTRGSASGERQVEMQQGAHGILCRR